MKKLSKTLGLLGGAALLASLVPTRFKRDEESGGFELGGLLWSLKKTPGEETDDYTLELLPFLNSGEDPAGEEPEEPAGEQAEAPAESEAPAEEPEASAAAEAPAEEPAAAETPEA